ARRALLLGVARVGVLARPVAGTGAVCIRVGPLGVVLLAPHGGVVAGVLPVPATVATASATATAPAALAIAGLGGAVAALPRGALTARPAVRVRGVVGGCRLRSRLLLRLRLLLPLGGRPGVRTDAAPRPSGLGRLEEERRGRQPHALGVLLGRVLRLGVGPVGGLLGRAELGHHVDLLFGAARG